MTPLLTLSFCLVTISLSPVDIPTITSFIIKPSQSKVTAGTVPLNFQTMS